MQASTKEFTRGQRGFEGAGRAATVIVGKMLGIIDDDAVQAGGREVEPERDVEATLEPHGNVQR
jgi:hypothetical protein